VEKVLMDEYLAGERTRLVQEAVHKERRSARLKMLSLQSFLRKGVSLSYVGRIKPSRS